MRNKGGFPAERPLRTEGGRAARVDLAAPSDSELPSLGAVSRKMPDLVSAAGGEERTREERGSTAAIV